MSKVIGRLMREWRGFIRGRGMERLARSRREIEGEGQEGGYPPAPPLFGMLSNYYQVKEAFPC